MYYPRGDAQHQYQQAAQYPDRRSADMRRVSGKAELAPGIAGIAGIASSSRSGLLGCQGSKSGRVIEENYPSSKADMTKEDMLETGQCDE
ncbi:hypothetical protein BASA61_008655 [Batrachochytrium salamandrivorans]|nr:hypothetical protein BASA61_008655 [Batrachochytrium salamandrivorans]